MFRILIRIFCMQKMLMVSKVTTLMLVQCHWQVTWLSTSKDRICIFPDLKVPWLVNRSLRIQKHIILWRKKWKSKTISLFRARNANQFRTIKIRAELLKTMTNPQCPGIICSTHPYLFQIVKIIKLLNNLLCPSSLSQYIVFSVSH